MGSRTKSLQKMHRPTLIWTSYNLFRLIALVFISWALVAQFIAVASDLDEYSNATGTSSPTATVGLSAMHRPAKIPSRLTRTPTSLIAVIRSQTSPSTTTSPPTIPSTTSVSTSEADQTAVIVLDPDGRPATLVNLLGLEASHSAATASLLIGVDERAANGMRRRAETNSATDANISYVGLSSVPDQPGGIFFLLMSRLVMAFVLSGLLFVQAGYPEKMLFKHLPWLGPQNPPLALGCLQEIIAIQNLQVHQKPKVLIPAWALLAVGSTNIVIAGAIWYRGRKYDRPAQKMLGFSLSTRLLYWTPPPFLYDAAVRRETIGSEFSATQGRDVEKRHRPSHDTAYDLGLPSEDEDDENDEGLVLVDPVPSAAKRRHALSNERSAARGPTRKFGEMTEEQDVRKGGYPTFAKGGIDQPGRHVPAGILERHGPGGHLVRYIREDGQMGVRRAAEVEKTRSKKLGVENGGVSDESADRQSRLPQPPQRKRTKDAVRQENTKLRSQSQDTDGDLKDRSCQIPTGQTSSNHLPLPHKGRRRPTDPLAVIAEDQTNPSIQSPHGNEDFTASRLLYSEPESIVDDPNSQDAPRTDSKKLTALPSGVDTLFPLPPERPTLALEAASSATANRKNSADSKQSPDDRLPPRGVILSSKDTSGSPPPPTLHHRELGDVPKTPTPPLGEGTLKVRDVSFVRENSPLREEPITVQQIQQAAVATRDYFSPSAPIGAAISSPIQYQQSSSASHAAVGVSVPNIQHPSGQQLLSDGQAIKRERATLTVPRAKSESSHSSITSRLDTLRSSMAIPRSPSSRSNRSNRTAQGVRFDLSPISTVSSGETRSAPNSPTRSLSPVSPPPKTALRIPGTRLTVSLPRFSVPGTPRPKGKDRSVSSLSSSTSAPLSESSDISDEVARPESMLSGELTTSFQEHAREAQNVERPLHGRSNTVDTLGGNYLDGGAEPTRDRHRRHSTVDSY
ncbi:hypothetical protein BD324DRAFT_681313 [Kockovaella imperatae]|uniref:Uncharacterized protein n=1 Tax=Kockovaella imperatae TaxID=4999 RepID=A0A1Y1UH83_9TREE|nr:hypothetical protein BD324DRAFT_681313 [Kockovaella imperatae]ORX37423.1 hypothetical protein BD324DRAFT_681313 [Kockovaella imperatae]